MLAVELTVYVNPMSTIHSSTAKNQTEGIPDVQNTHVLRELATEREAQLRRRTSLIGRERPTLIRRRIGEGLVRFGAWVAAEPRLRQAREGAR